MLAGACGEGGEVVTLCSHDIFALFHDNSLLLPRKQSVTATVCSRTAGTAFPAAPAPSLRNVHRASNHA